MADKEESNQENDGFVAISFLLIVVASGTLGVQKVAGEGWGLISIPGWILVSFLLWKLGH